MLAGKGINHESVQVDLSNKPAWLRELNPRNRVPVLEHDGHVIYESEALAEYLDEVFARAADDAADPVGRARVRMLMRRFEDRPDAYYAARRGEDGALEEMHAQLGWVERLLGQHDYLARRRLHAGRARRTGRGSSASIGSAAAWTAYPAIRAWMERLDERPEYRDEQEILGLGATPGSSAAR